MRRVRQTSPGLSPAIFGRMSAAVAFSAALHVFLIYGLSLPANRDSGERVTVIQARLMSAQSAGRSPPAELSERLGTPDTFGPARTAIPQPAPKPAELSTAPTPVTVPIDPEPVVPAGDDAQVATIPDPVHYPAKDLDVYPQALQRIIPAYPDTARDAQVAGFVTLEVSIDEVGKVVRATVMDSAPNGVFEETAERALASAAFYPAQKDGRQVRSRILIKVEFDPALTADTQ